MEEKKLGVGYKLAWSSRGVSLAINVLVMGYLTYYLTDVIGMSAGLVGGLLLASKVFDGVTDILVGFVIDRTHSRLGKARPYQAFILPCWLLTILLFAIPQMGTGGQAVYVFVLYTLVNSVCATFLNGSDALCLQRISETKKQQVSLSAINGIMVMIFCILYAILFPQLMDEYMGVDKGRWVLVMAVTGVILGAVGMARFFACKERKDILEDKKSAETLSLKESVSTLMHNKYILMLTAIVLLYNLATGLFTATNTYYFKYIVGNVGLASVVGAANLLTPVAIAFFPRITAKTGIVKFMRYGFLAAIAGYVIRILGGTSVVTLMLGTVLTMVGTISASAYINVYIVDCISYGRWKTGKSADGLVSSITAFGNKIGNSVASGLTGFIMGLAGYVGTASVQTESAIRSIHVLFNWLPLAALVVMFFIALRYDLDALMPRIRQELEEG